MLFHIPGEIYIRMLSQSMYHCTGLTYFSFVSELRLFKVCLVNHKNAVFFSELNKLFGIYNSSGYQNAGRPHFKVPSKI